MKAVGEFILLEQISDNPNGFDLPDGTDMRYLVLSIGKKVEEVKAGDTIIAYIDAPFEVEGKKYWFVTQDRVIAVK